MDINVRRTFKDNAFLNDFNQEDQNTLGFFLLISFGDLFLRTRKRKLKGFDKSIQAFFSFDPNMFVLIDEKKKQFLEKER